MAKPLPTLVIPPAKSGGTGQKLSYTQLRGLWIQAGGDPALASTMAAIALAESGGNYGTSNPKSLNDNASTGDYSVGPWQINYFGNLRTDRTARFGAAAKLRNDPLANAKAAVALVNSGPSVQASLGNWTTYTSGAYTAFLRPETPQEKADAATAEAQAKAASPGYVAATTDLSVEKSTAVAQAKATLHVSDPWVTVTRNRRGDITGFGTSTGESAPGNVLTIGGQAATQSLFNQTWDSTYANDFAAYTGQQASPAQIADVLERGVSVYTLRDELSKQPGFVNAPVYKAHAGGLLDYAKQVLGAAAPPDFVRKAIAQDWDQATFQAELKKLPAYLKGPEFTGQFDQNLSTYQGVYGEPDQAAKDWLKDATVAGWSQDQLGAKLRSDPAYKFSVEYQSKALSFLGEMGLFTGQRPVAVPKMPPPAVKNSDVYGKAPTLEAGLGKAA